MSMSSIQKPRKSFLKRHNSRDKLRGKLHAQVLTVQGINGTRRPKEAATTGYFSGELPAHTCQMVNHVNPIHWPMLPESGTIPLKGQNWEVPDRNNMKHLGFKTFERWIFIILISFLYHSLSTF